MEVGELFVSLGVKGSDKTLNAFTQVKAGLGGIASTSLEVKAAIIGAMYALEHLMSASAQRGTDLSNFNALTGISVKQLQQWQFAARQAGESNEDFAGSLKSVQEKMAQMKLGKGQPEGLAILANTVGFDKDKAYKDSFYVLQQLQKFAHSNVSTDIQNQILKSFGISENMIAAMRKNVFNESNFKRAPIYGDAEVNQLSKVNVLWGNLENKIQMLFGHFTAAHGAQLVGDISKIADKVFKMVNAFEKLAEQLKIFQAIGNAFNGWAIIFEKTSIAIDKFGIKLELVGKQIQFVKTITDGFKEISEKLGPIFNMLFPSQSTDKNLTPQQKIENKKFNETVNTQFKKNDDYNLISTLSNIIYNLYKEAKDKSKKNEEFFSNFRDTFFSPNNKLENNPKIPDIKNNISPNIPNSSQSQTTNQNTNINQNLYFQHEGKEYPKIKDSVQKSVGDAWKQLSAQSQGT